MTQPRVIVTVSRTWRDREAMYAALFEAHRVLSPYGVPVLVHGDDGRGDEMARQIWLDAGLPEEPHKADWNGPCDYTCNHARRTTYCPQAGYRRNDEMVALGANLCVALINPCEDKRCRRKGKHGTHGASHCADAAEAAGITTWRYP